MPHIAPTIYILKVPDVTKTKVNYFFRYPSLRFLLKLQQRFEHRIEVLVGGTAMGLGIRSELKLISRIF